MIVKLDTDDHMVTSFLVILPSICMEQELFIQFHVFPKISLNTKSGNGLPFNAASKLADWF